VQVHTARPFPVVQRLAQQLRVPTYFADPVFLRPGDVAVIAAPVDPARLVPALIVAQDAVVTARFIRVLLRDVAPSVRTRAGVVVLCFEHLLAWGCSPAMHVAQESVVLAPLRARTSRARMISLRIVHVGSANAPGGPRRTSDRAPSYDDILCWE